MATGSNFSSPLRDHYDVIIIGGAVMGSASAWFLASNPDFDGSILVVERDPAFTHCSSALSLSGVRHQFSCEINIRISMFASGFIREFREIVGDEDAPDLNLIENGYLFLASENGKAVLEQNHAAQTKCGARTELMTPDEISRKFPFFATEDIALGSWNPEGEGWFDGPGMARALRKAAIRIGAEYCSNEVVGLECNASKVNGVRLSTGEVIGCGTMVNCSGPRASLVAGYAGIKLPVVARKRNVFVLSCDHPIEGEMPLTIDPTGIYVRPEGAYFLSGFSPSVDPDVDYDDFEILYDQFDEVIWPILANRIPQFERLKVVNAWAGHYAYNTLDQNAIIGFHPEISNFMFVNGFSGHGMQQSPAMGRGVSEMITYGEYRSLDLRELGFERVIRNEPLREQAVV